MNISRGVFRIAQVIKWAGRIIAFAVFLALISHPLPSKDELIFPVGLAIGSVIVTGFIAWILEGFSGE